MANVESSAPHNGPLVLDVCHGNEEHNEEQGDALEQWSTTAVQLLNNVRAAFSRLALDGPGSRDTPAVNALRAAIDEFSAVLSADETPRFERDLRFIRVQNESQHLIPFPDKLTTTAQAWNIIPAHDKASISPFGVSVGGEYGVASVRYGVTQLGAAKVQQICQFLQKRRDIGKTVPLHFTTVVNLEDHGVLAGCALPTTLCMNFDVSIVASTNKVSSSTDLQSSPWIPARSTISPERLALVRYKESSIFRFQLGAAQVVDQLRPSVSSAHMVQISVAVDVEFLEHSITDCPHGDFVGLVEYAAMLLVQEKLLQAGYVHEGHWALMEGFTVLVSSENSENPASLAHCIASSLTITKESAGAASVVDTPANIVNTPVNIVDTTANAVDVPANIVDIPTLNVGVDAPANAVDTPANAVNVPADIVDTPANAVDVPADISANVVDVPANVADISANVVDVPANVVDVPANIVDTSANFVFVIAVPAAATPAPTPVNTPTTPLTVPAVDLTFLDVVHLPPAQPVADISVRQPHFQPSEDLEWYTELYELL